jgi:hypothetical protein
MSYDLRQKIIEAICALWPTEEGYLLGADIYEHLRSQGVQIPDHAVNNALAELAGDGRITLTIAGREFTVHDIEDDLCQ